MLKNKLILLLLALTLACSFAVSAAAQDRKAVQQVAPVYPELARKMKVTGRVRVEVLVAADGHVKSANALTGNPLLKDAAVRAVRNWKFESGNEATTIVSVDFEI